MKHQHIFKV